MKKKLFSAFAAILVLVISVATLVACNPYKNPAIGGGDATAPVESNGGYIVKQGNYVYFVNGYVGADADATWGGAPISTSRAFLSIGKVMISLMLGSLARSMTIRSTPGAIPACGGAP